MTGRPSGDQWVFDALTATFLELAQATGSDPGRAGGCGRDPECAWAWSPVAMPDVNRVLAPRLGGEPAAIEARIEAINARFGGLPLTWWLDPASTPADLAATIAWVVPFTARDAVTVMALDLAALDAGPAGAPPGLSVALAERPDELVVAELLAARGFGAADDDAEPFAALFRGVAAPADGPLVIAVAGLDGRPGAAALGILAGDVLGVYNVATIPALRRRGLARAALGTVLAEGRRRGARMAVLESSQAGVGLYRGLGFRDAGQAIVVTIPGS